MHGFKYFTATKMKDYFIFLKEVEGSLLKLSRKKRILLSVVNCERLLDCYVAFQNKFGWGDHRVLKDSIDMVYQYLINEDLFNEDDFLRQLKKVDTITPHMDDFSDVIASFALNACTSVENTLDYILNGKVDVLKGVGVAAYDTVDMFVQEKENLNPKDVNFEQKIWNDVVVQNELAYLLTLLSKLTRLEGDTITDKIISNLKSANPIIDLTLLN